MDEIVKQAMAKWPNVPHCYGWLSLDARGQWRMNDGHGRFDVLRNPALIGFINRNYQSDEAGNWYFQNGPQRVYVRLETTPFVARTDPHWGLVLHTGEALLAPDWAGIGGDGEIVVKAGDKLAQVDDRDLAELLGRLSLQDDALLDWLAQPQGELTLWDLALERVDLATLPAKFGYVKTPGSDTGASDP